METSCPRDQLQCCFENWINQQQKDLDELNETLRDEEARRNEDKLRFMTQKNIKHFQEYHEKRIGLLKDDPPSSFSSTWCTPFESSFLWIAGCRPTLTIQLIYTLCGSELEAHLDEFLDGVRKGNMGELSASQLNQVNELHCKTVREEEELSNRLARLQEDIGEYELNLIWEDKSENRFCGSDDCFMKMGSGGSGVDVHANELGCILEEADRLRLETMKELIGILSPLQAADFLVAAKKLYLSMHEWGTKRKDSTDPEHYGHNSHEFSLS